MVRGDVIKLRAYGGEILIRRVVAIEDGIVFVSKEEEFEAANKESREPVAVGFHIGDVLKNDH